MEGGELPPYLTMALSSTHSPGAVCVLTSSGGMVSAIEFRGGRIPDLPLVGSGLLSLLLPLTAAAAAGGALCASSSLRMTSTWWASEPRDGMPRSALASETTLKAAIEEPCDTQIPRSGERAREEGADLVSEPERRGLIW